MIKNVLHLKRTVQSALLVLLLCVAGLTNATAQTFSVGNLNYSINSDGVSVTVTGHVDGQNATGELVIPENVEYLNISYEVTKIAERAFEVSSGFTGDLVIPNSVTRIEKGAFWGCSGLTGSLTLSDNVTYIGDIAFCSCGFTGTLTIPESVTWIGALAFGDADYTTLCYNAINCGELRHYWNIDLGFMIWSDTNDSFEGLDSITNLIIGENVQNIPNYAFRSLSGLTGNLVIPNSVTSFGNYAFQNCSGLSGTLDLPDSVTSIGIAAFQGCTGFTGSLTIPNSVSFIGNHAFDGCTGLSGSLTIGNSVASIYENAFRDNGFTSLYFNAVNYSTIHSTWLQGVSSLTSLSIGEDVQRIPDGFVNGKDGITGSLTIPNSVYYIGANAFTDCTGFSGTLTLGNSVMQIGNSAFFGACEGFTSFDVKPETPPTLGSNVFTSANYDMPVLVPCGSLDAYSNASGWDVFTNIQEPDPCLWDITATANPENAGTISGAGTYEQGSTCTLTATPNEDYAFVNWTEDGEEVSAEASYSFTITGNRDLVANFRYIRYEITATANPAEGGTISGIGSYLEGETCMLTATPNEGYDFVNWTENGEEVSTETSYSFTVTGDRDLMANFALATYTITVMPNPIEGGTVAFMYDFGNGTMQGWSSIDADGDGYGWGHWNASSHSGGSGFVYSQSWVSNRILYPDNYLVSPIVSFCAGSFVTFYARAQDASYAAEHFGVAVSTTSNTNPNDFTTIQEWTLSAKGRGTSTEVLRGGNRDVGNWYQYTVDLSAYAGQSGYVAIRHFNCSDMYWIDIDDISISSDAFTANYVIGSNCTMIATPNYGYTFDNWTENGNVVSNDETYSFTTTGDSDLVANFVKVPFSITVMPNFNDRGTVSGAGEYVIDSTCTLTATPAEGHSFVCWLENGEVVSTEAEYTFTVEGPRDLVAVFSPMEGTYIVFADPNVEAICLNNWDTDGDGFLSYDEAAAVTNLNQVFYYNREITSFDELQYFTGLTFINEYEFYTCQNLTSIIIPESVTSIGRQAFLECYSLGGTLTINENVTYIGWGAFYYTNFSTLNYNAINCEMGGQWLDAATSSLTSLNIGENVEVIPHRAFRNCYNVTGELVIPNSVTYIEAYAFEGCSGFTSITIPEGITSIEEWTFAGCSSAETINLPSTLESIGYSAFSYCNSLLVLSFLVP